MTDNELRNLLERNQHAISETTGLLKRLHELSVAIGENHPEQIRELKLAQLETKQALLDFQIAVQEALLKLAETVERFVRGQHGNGHPPHA